MRVRFLKDHLGDKIGSEEDVPEPLANYLIRVKVAEEVKKTYYGNPEFGDAEDAQRILDWAEKVNKDHKAKEKQENKTGNVPTAKKKKK